VSKSRGNARDGCKRTANGLLRGVLDRALRESPGTFPGHRAAGGTFEACGIKAEIETKLIDRFHGSTCFRW